MLTWILNNEQMNIEHLISVFFRSSVPYKRKSMWPLTTDYIYVFNSVYWVILMSIWWASTLWSIYFFLSFFLSFFLCFSVFASNGNTQPKPFVSLLILPKTDSLLSDWLSNLKHTQNHLFSIHNISNQSWNGFSSSMATQFEHFVINVWNYG